MNIHPNLQPIFEEAVAHIGRPYFPAQDRLYWLANTLDFEPANQDGEKILRLHVDEQGDFLEPYTYIDTDGLPSYIMPAGTEGVPLLPHMEGRVTYLDPADFNPYDYPQVLGGRLSVAGAWNDAVRTLEFDFAMMDKITKHAFSVDQHAVSPSVFDQHRFIARFDNPDKGVVRGQNPLPYTVIMQSDIYHKTQNPDGIWWPVKNADWTYEYAGELMQKANMPLIIWTRHCTRMTAGANILPSIWNMAMIHSYARKTEPVLYFKGLSTESEHYGIYQAEVEVSGDPSTQPNLTGLQMYTQYDKIIITGQAASHCVLSTVSQLVNFIFKKDPDQVRKLIVASDATTPIAGFEDDTEKAFAEMQQKNLQVMTLAEIAQLIS